MKKLIFFLFVMVFLSGTISIYGQFQKCGLFSEEVLNNVGRDESFPIMDHHEIIYTTHFEIHFYDSEYRPGDINAITLNEAEELSQIFEDVWDFECNFLGWPTPFYAVGENKYKVFIKNFNDYYGLSSVKTYDLSQNYPNPFNPSTTIKYQIPKNGFVTLKVYDILGKEVKTLVSENKPTGRYEVLFNASDLASGIYIYQLKSNEFSSIKKMML